MPTARVNLCHHGRSIFFRYFFASMTCIDSCSNDTFTTVKNRKSTIADGDHSNGRWSQPEAGKLPPMRASEAFFWQEQVKGNVAGTARTKSTCRSDRKHATGKTANTNPQLTSTHKPSTGRPHPCSAYATTLAPPHHTAHPPPPPTLQLPLKTCNPNM